jgi:hypothetical protein
MMDLMTGSQLKLTASGNPYCFNELFVAHISDNQNCSICCYYIYEDIHNKLKKTTASIHLVRMANSMPIA